jgi:hypothetical protein
MQNNFHRGIDFLDEIGIRTQIAHLSDWEQKQCFLPKVLLDLLKAALRYRGMLRIDPTAEIGDILHEAGHLAIFPTTRIFVLDI